MTVSRDKQDTLSSNLVLSGRNAGERAGKAVKGITNVLWAKIVVQNV